MANPTVIVVPGFLGSTLLYNTLVFKNKVLWLDKLALLANGPNPMDLAADGVSPGPLASGPLAVGGQVSANIYDGLLQQLTDNGFQWRFFAYDWRLSLQTHAQDLATYIRTTFANIPIVVIGHSAGGLIARLAYPIYNGSGPSTNWIRNIYLCTPQGGSYSSAQSLAGQYSLGSWLYSMANWMGLLGGSGIPSLFQGQSLQQRFQQVIASWPALNELLPTAQPPFDNSDPLVPQLYQLATWQNQNQYVTAARLAAATATQVVIAGLPSRQRTNEVSVIGVGIQTAYQLQAANPLDDNGSYFFDNNGDGVVHADRAQLAGANTLNISIAHQTAPSSGSFTSQVVDLILNGLPGPETIPTPQEPVFQGKGQIFLDPPKTAVNSTLPFPNINRTGDP